MKKQKPFMQTWRKKKTKMNTELNNPIDLPSGFSLGPLQDDAIDHVLEELSEKCPAQFILLAEVSGQILSAKGERGSADLVALSSLVVGDLAASQEIARLTGQYENYQMILREGPEANTFISEAGSYLALYVRVGNNVPIGWARLLIQEASRQLAMVVLTHSEKLKNLDLGLNKEKFTTLFEGGLESIWKG